ncbi:MAG: hypothetical protein J5875_09475 [Paludibacteraceae bacterium]|nr:hypothetical protein [Paludibacteraceae bacterium]
MTCELTVLNDLQVSFIKGNFRKNGIETLFPYLGLDSKTIEDWGMQNIENELQQANVIYKAEITTTNTKEGAIDTKSLSEIETLRKCYCLLCVISGSIPNLEWISSFTENLIYNGNVVYWKINENEELRNNVNVKILGLHS